MAPKRVLHRSAYHRQFFCPSCRPGCQSIGRGDESLSFTTFGTLDRHAGQNLNPAVDADTAETYASLLNQLRSLEAVATVDEKQASSINDERRRVDKIQRRAGIVHQLPKLEDTFGAGDEDISADSLESLIGKSAIAQVVASAESAIAILVTESALRLVDLPELKDPEVTSALECLYGKDRLSMAKLLEFPEAGKKLRKILKWL